MANKYESMRRFLLVPTFVLGSLIGNILGNKIADYIDCQVAREECIDYPDSTRTIYGPQSLIKSSYSKEKILENVEKQMKKNFIQSYGNLENKSEERE